MMKMLLFQESEFSSLLVVWEEEFALDFVLTDFLPLSFAFAKTFVLFIHSFCSSIIPSVFAVVAFFLAWMGTLGCRFIQFDLTTNNSTTTRASITTTTTTSQDFITVHFGIWYRQSVELYNYTASGNGYYQVSTCTDYNNDDNIDVDPSWMAARAFSTMVLILGGIALLIALVTCCCVGGSNNNKCCCVPSNIDLMNGIIYLLISLLQGLTLIILSSQLCQNNGDITKMMENGDVIVIDNNFPETCNLSQGAKCVISATVLWFFAGIMSLNLYKGERRRMEEAKKKNSLLVMDAAYSAAPLLP